MISKDEFEQLVKEVGTQAATKINDMVNKLDLELSEKFKAMLEGVLQKDAFDQFQKEELAKINLELKKLEDIDQAQKKMASEFLALIESQKNAPQRKDIGAVLLPLLPKMKEMQKAGTGYFEITSSEMKAAGVTSISGSINPSSPYLPGIGGTPLEYFDIIRPQDFMLTRVDMGSTDQSRVAWVNETGYDGTVDTNIAESGTKPLVQHYFNVELSTAKKAAAYSILTEEFQDDVPQLFSEVKGMLQRDVIRALDGQIQTDVFAVAKPYNLPGLSMEIFNANLWDAAYALWTQPGYYEFQPNTIAWNSLTNAKVQMSKNNNGTYLVPPFKDQLAQALVLANKFPTNVALAGDLTQYRVRMYKDYTLRIGWINDQFIKNQFCILGELRYHSFISDNRKWALAKGDLNNIADIINGNPGS